MAHSQVVATIEAHVSEAWPHTIVYAEDDNRGVPDDASSFLVVSFPWSRSEQASIGAPGQNWWREEGAFVLMLALPRGAGVREGRAWLDGFACTVRGRDIGKVRCRAPQSAVLDDDPADTSHVRITMAVPYLFDLVG